MLIVGLTGGIGSGKSTAAEYFQKLGVPVIDADAIVRELSQPGQTGFEQIVERFGPGILDAEGGLDRRKLRDIIFNDPEKKAALEAILHPLVRQTMLERAEQLQALYCIFMIPLLFESEQRDLVDRVLVIDAAEALQRARTQQRDRISRNQVNQIMRQQIGRQARLSLADDVIHNNGDLDDFHDAIDALNARYQQLALQPHQHDHDRDENTSADTPQDHASMSAIPWLSEPLNDAESDQTVTDTSAATVVYELPLNEKVRNLLRLEGLFDEIQHYCQGDSLWDSRAAIKTLLTILSVFHNRPDTKAEVIKEMDRINGMLQRYANLDDVDTQALRELSAELGYLSRELRAQPGKLGEQVRKNDFIASLKQRENIPGGTLPFELPGYAYWLKKPASLRKMDIQDWLSEFELIQRAVALLLKVIRESAMSSREMAKSGYFQSTLETTSTYQMIRVMLPAGECCCAEISGGRHRFSIRFLQLHETGRAIACKKDIAFQLICCSL